MFRQSCIRLAKQGTSRTVVRDPRKNKAAISAVVKTQEEEIASSLQNQTQMNQPAFAPSEQNQQSVGSALGTYALAGAGMSLGFILVGAIFGI